MELWDLDAKRPMVETTYHDRNDSDGNILNNPFIWIVEPAEDGRLYILAPGAPGNGPHLEDLELTIKDLAEDLAPYSAGNPPMVYTAEKRNVMYVLDARTGKVLRQFSSGGSSVTTAESCEPQATGFGVSSQLQCKGTLTIGQTEYTIGIQDQATGENICTIKYFEWTPNRGDRDLHSQYLSTMDSKYIYSKFDGEIIGIDHTGDKNKLLRRPMFRKKLSAPVVRVFDVARPYDDDNPEPALVILPQPVGPAMQEDGLEDVWVNSTDAGSWYALSERKYPAVTDGAQAARCYRPDYQLLTYNGRNLLPDRHSLVGVHSLGRIDQARDYIAIGPGPVVNEPPPVPKEQTGMTRADSEPPLDFRVETPWFYYVLAFALVITTMGGYGLSKPGTFEHLKKKVLVHVPKVEPAIIAVKPLQSEKVDSGVEPPSPSPVEPSEPIKPTETADEPTPVPKERKVVKFNLDDEDEEDDLEPLSRATTIDDSLPDTDVTSVGGAEGDVKDGAPDAAPATPKKKKTHRGKRGSGRKKREQREMQEVDRIVKAAKELDHSVSLHPDEITLNDDDVQDVSNIKKIGKLTIDFDRVLGNGSGGTFVFAGRWNVSLAISYLMIS